MTVLLKQKQLRKKARGNATPGKMKNKQCQATPLKRYLAKRSRSYKHPDYDNWKDIFSKR